MISTEVSPWTSRVLSNGVLGIAPEENWKLQAYESYGAKLRAADFPCFFGQTGEIRGEMIYTFHLAALRATVCEGHAGIRHSPGHSGI